MTELEKIKVLIDIGYKCNFTTGAIYNSKGNIVTNSSFGYIILTSRHEKKTFRIRGHRLVYYMEHMRLPKFIDHINGIRNDNRICNLREVTSQQNAFNRNFAKGWRKTKYNKYHVQIWLSGKAAYIGSYLTEQEAHQAYLDAKKIYHIHD